MLDVHYLQLMDIQPATSKTHSLRTFYHNAEKYLRSLESLGEDVGHVHQIMMLMRFKFSKQVMTRLEEKKDVTEQWTLDNFSKHLKAYIEAR